MKKMYAFISVFLLGFFVQTSYSQTQAWSSFVDDIPSLSSPRMVDLTGDGVLDVVIGGGTDSTFSLHGIMAFNGATGALLWELPSENEIFTSAQFQDINGDNIPDIFIGGRDAQLFAIDGATGAIIWEFYTLPDEPSVYGLYNFYSPQLIPDVSGDLIPDIVVTNGGDHAAPVWETDRPPGHVMVINGANGNLIAQAVVPDSAETYCSPVVADLRNDGNLWVIFGTGGETLPGSMWAVELSELLTNDISNAQQIVSHPTLGFIAPPSVADYSGTGVLDIIIQAYGGTVYRVKGSNFGVVWSTTIPGTESSAAPVIGNFTGTIEPDVFCVLSKGTAPSYTDFYQVMIDGVTGNIISKDSIGALHFASANAFDANGDGRDEVLVSLNNHIGYFQHQLMLFDFQNNTRTNYWNAETGVNIGCTPWIGDMDNNGDLEIIYVVKEDSLNPMGWQGINVRRLNTGIQIPIAGIAWGSYMGTEIDGHYTYLPVNCGTASILSGATVVQPSCNGFSDGSITPLTANGTPPFTYLWSDGSVGSSLTNIPAGTYTLRITDANGCYETASQTLSNPFTIGFGGISHVLCPDGSNGQATVSSSGCSCMFSGCTYLWDNGGTTYTGTNLDAGLHEVEITHTNGCIVVATININDGAPLVDSVIFQNISCSGFDDGYIEIIPVNSSNTSYEWNTLETTSSVSNLAPGNYSVIVEDTRPCADTLEFIVEEPDAILVNVTSEDILCNGDGNGEIDVIVSGGTGSLDYFAGTENNQNGNFTSLSGGNYDVYVLDSMNCSSDTVSVTIIEPSVLNTSVSSTSESVSGNGTATVTISGGTSPYSQVWNDPSSQTTTTATGLTGGSYIVEVTDDNGCVITDTVEVIITIGVTENGEEIPVLVYPNPAADFVVVDFGSKDISDYTVRLMDMSGRFIGVNSALSKNSVRIVKGNISTGNYFLILQNEKSSLQVKVVFN